MLHAGIFKSFTMTSQDFLLHLPLARHASSKYLLHGPYFNLVLTIAVAGSSLNIFLCLASFATFFNAS